MHQGNGFAPETLAGEHPVAQFVIYGLLTDAFLLKVGGNGIFEIGGLHAVVAPGIDGDSVLFESRVEFIGKLAVFRDDLDDRDAELRRELEVALVVRGERP